MSEAGTDKELTELEAEINEVGQRAAKTVELGRRGFVIAVAVFVLLVGQVLPWVGDHVGWQVLLGDGGPIPQLFAATSAGFGVLASVLALGTRRWWLSWVCAVGGWFSFVDGMLAVWSQQSSHANNAVGGGPGIGMIVALVTMIVLGVNWMRTAWSHS
ncbi:membrane protein [Amycolatopsis minnesotensis]|uniref:Membrane protein n=1 Tax=Amycolatopsis minnesotensis TaxID=337894 RepID=A0ABP5CLZ1_9PSEU